MPTISWKSFLCPKQLCKIERQNFVELGPESFAVRFCRAVLDRENSSRILLALSRNASPVGQ